MSKSPSHFLKSLYNTELIILLLAIGLLAGLFIIQTISSKPARSSKIPPSALQNILTSCQNDRSSRCYAQFFATFNTSHPVSQSLELLNQLQKKDQTALYCHTIAHAIASSEVAKDPANWTQLFAKFNPNECSRGFFHGIIEGKNRADPTFVLTAQNIDNICNQIGQQVSLTQKTAFVRSCGHAMGHILLVQQEGDITSSLSVCNQLNQIQLNQTCFQGVFMEHIQKENLTFHNVEQKEVWDDQFLGKEQINCNKYTDPLQMTECWRSLGPVTLAIGGGSIEKIHNLCDVANNSIAAHACYREAVGLIAIDSTPQSIGDVCQPSKKTQSDYQNCIDGVVGYVLLTSPKYKPLIEQFCQKIDSTDYQYCQQLIKTYSN